MKSSAQGFLCNIIIFLFVLSLTESLFSQTVNDSGFVNKKSKDTLTLDNDYVIVMHNSSAFGPAHIKNIGTRIIVALTEVKINSSRGALKLVRGQTAVFKADESYNSIIGEFFEIALKIDHPPVEGPEKWLEPTGNIMVYNDEQFRIFEERLEPGGERQLHSHSQRIVVRLNEVQLTDPRFPKKGRPGAGLQVPNTVKFAEPVVHVVRNLSKIPLFNIVIELKVPH
jgi:hypothetical protein